MEGTELTPAENRRSTIIEVSTAIILGLATLGAAYAAYQASMYDGNSLDGYSTGIAKINESNRQQLEAAQGFTLDMITWMEWQSRIMASERETGDKAKVDAEIAQSIEEEFMEDRLKEALVWADEESAKKKTRVHPTDSDAYALELFGEAFETEAESTKMFEKARKANDMGDKFTLITVYFTIVLFFSGITTAFKRDPVKLTMLALSAVFLAYTTVKLFQLPAAG